MKKYQFLLMIGLALLVMSGCKKGDSLAIPPEFANFANQTTGVYEITGPTVSYKIPVGLSTIAAQDRTVTISISSPTGAVEGTHYNVDSKTVTIPAGQALDSLTLQGVFSQYLTGRKDTLVFTISEPGARPSDYNSTFTLLMRGPCFEAEIMTDVTALNGTYNAFESGYNPAGVPGYVDYGPYPSVISGAKLLSSTTAEIEVDNIYEVPNWKAKFVLDFTDINDRKLSFTSQVLGHAGPLGDASLNISIEPPAATPNPPVNSYYSFCTPEVFIKFRLGVRNQSTGALLGYVTSGGQIRTYTMKLRK